MKREDDFEKRRKHLANLSDDELYNKFWELADEIVKPMVEIGKTNTTPSIERSILLRMGFSSLEAQPIVDSVMKMGLMGKGCGNVVWRLSENKKISIREAGLLVGENKEEQLIKKLF